ncbi:MAG: 1,4-alpha-glucan branching protein GlgB [Candidatus Heteroscillospira sp.]|jgi:1,4-alpha-glucan branching enzyme
MKDLRAASVSAASGKYRDWEYYGCHYVPEKNAHIFRVWAPRAESVSVIGDFNGWDEKANICSPLPGGVWEALIPGLKDGDIYKYAVTGCHGACVHKADPFAFHSETGPRTGSRVWDISAYCWQDSVWRKRERRRDMRKSPLNIYELHMGSWRKPGDALYPWYRTVADELAEYCVDMGYTHVELLPLTEYPYDGSWGYQVTGYFCPTSRYGTPQDFMYFVDRLHRSGIGVIMDWVPAHFPRDGHGLAMFDGTPAYERSEARMAAHPQWGTLIFDYAKPEVRSFLISSALFFREVYHIDGLRVDAVSSMLYLDYCRGGGYTPNELGGNIDLSAVSFLQELNTRLTALGCMTIAEESAAYPGVTAQVRSGGLGFTFKWDMGFMHDTLDYFSMDPIYRSHHHSKLTFSMMYAFSEYFILAFSHDEVVHGKKSMVDKMYGSYEEKFAALRAMYGYQYAHPGKKLGFMGGEFAQFIEWDYQKQLDWFLLKYPAHDSTREYMRELNHFYKSHPSLYRVDDSWDGFEWLNVDDSSRSCIAFMRRADRARAIVCVCNFTPVCYQDYMIGMNRPGTLRLALSSDESRFGGSGAELKQDITVRKNGFYGYSHSALLTLPGNSCLYYEFIPSGKGGKRK